jgi:hypothetical protein
MQPESNGQVSPKQLGENEKPEGYGQSHGMADNDQPFKPQ